MILISPQRAEYLYWMGRYIQRAESMTRLVISLFDKILDEDFDDAKKVYSNLGITLTYDSSQAFLRQSVFDVEYASLLSVISAARENAILTRPNLSHRMFSRINALYLAYQKAKEERTVSLYWLESTLQELDAIWGNLELSLVESKEVPLIQLGKVIERMDLNIRIYDSMEAAVLDLEKLNSIAHKIRPNSKPIGLSSSQKQKLLHKINSVYGTLAYVTES
ncbi:alpha-E domain-containing protein [Sulfurospirillum barnesii]|uniref:DUF403 domain-containing protein n=1 Tax=Sulfurospirillum barnesii (strain ATCC 700032 / DSM 10660 / SES-3) TaxID=760154 RepID=I3XW29_SULBS|nr:alpha-E domain-containing protein [Sulfurospirillum barnesii]AFL68153.1 hypothetical protein Sulba_0851 [Sulfurospirillum barnesii SES-3]